MEEESFEDEEIAKFLNEQFISVKVDREERPDIDAIYMAAVQALTNSGGWPMSVWLTPEGKPFGLGLISQLETETVEQRPDFYRCCGNWPRAFPGITLPRFRSKANA